MTIRRTHPGKTLAAELAAQNLSARALALELGVPSNRISAIINGSRRISAETALLLARRFKTTPEFWMNLQTAHDLELARAAQKEGKR